MNSMLSITADKYNQTLSFGEALGFGGQMVLVGMGAVFAVLGIIWAVLTVFKFFFTSANNKPAPTEKTPAPVQAPVSASCDAEIVAVIAAAIAAAESESCGKIKFRVVSFKRK